MTITYTTLTDTMVTADAETRLAPGSTWSPVAGDLLVAFVTYKHNADRYSSGDPGNGGAWSQISGSPHLDNQGQLTSNLLYYEVTTGFTGTPDIDLNAADDAAAQFHLISSDVGPVAINASAWADTGATDDDTPTVSLTYTDADEILGIVAHRDRTVTVGSGYTAVTLNTTNGAGGGQDASVSSERDATPGASPVTVDATLSSAHDWTIVALALTVGNLVVYGDTSDAEIRSGNGTYSVARAGTGTLQLQPSTGTSLRLGQWNSAGVHWIAEGFVNFDVSGILSGTAVTAAAIKFRLDGDLTIGSEFDLQVRLNDWGDTLTTGDWVPGADLSSKSLLASIDTTAIGSTGQLKTMTEESGLAGAIEDAVAGDGILRTVWVSSRTTDGNAPSTSSFEYITISSSNQTGTANDPQIVIDYEFSASVTFPVTMQFLENGIGPARAAGLNGVLEG